MEFKEYLVTKNFCPVLTLQPYTNYTFAVRSYSRRGASEPSHVTCQTKESGTEECLPLPCSFALFKKKKICLL